MKGRKPTPTALHQLHGNPSHLRKQIPARRAVEPPGGAAIPPPADFSEEQRTLWLEALADAPPGVLRHIDASALTVWVTACDLHRRAREALGRSSMLVKPAKDSEATPVQSPLLAIVNRQAIIMLRAAEILGFTPTSRPRLAGVAPLLPGRPSDGPAEMSLADYIASAPEIPKLN